MTDQISGSGEPQAVQTTSATGPGLILSVMVALCTALIVIPVVGIAMVLHQSGLLSTGALMAIMSRPSHVVIVAVLPTVLLFLLALTFLVAFFRRARWGPRVVSVFALCWAIATGTTMVLVPMMAMPDGLPTLTILGMIPAMIAPVFFALGFAGFMMNSESAGRWFSRNTERSAHG